MNLTPWRFRTHDAAASRGASPGTSLPTSTVRLTPCLYLSIRRRRSCGPRLESSSARTRHGDRSEQGAWSDRIRRPSRVASEWEGWLPAGAFVRRDHRGRHPARSLSCPWLRPLLIRAAARGLPLVRGAETLVSYTIVSASDLCHPESWGKKRALPGGRFGRVGSVTRFSVVRRPIARMVPAPLRRIGDSHHRPHPAKVSSFGPSTTMISEGEREMNTTGHRRTPLRCSGSASGPTRT